MEKSIRKTVTKTICAALAAMMLCTSCGDVGTEPSQTSGGSAAASSSAEAPTNSSEQKPVTKPDSATLKGLANFSAGLLKNSCGEEIKEGSNVLLSPESVLIALSMTAGGANGETLSQMCNVMQGSADLTKLEDAMRYLGQSNHDTEGVKVNIANSIWANKEEGFALKQSFADACKQKYGAECFCLPFDGKALDDINSWVNSNTNGMIPTILDQIPPNTELYLINAIAFEAEWYKQYETDQVREDGTFTNGKGEKEECTMLFSEESKYMSDGSAQAFYKLYKGGKYAFMGILPNEGVSVSDYIAGLDGESWYNLVNSCTDEDVEVLIPEFTYDYDSILNDGLISMGMELPFTEAADFKGIADYEHDSFFINRVIHKTYIEVDRKGTKAAAATAVEMKCEDAVMLEEEPKRIYLNRPFVYAIVDVETGFPMFLGAVNTTAKETAQQ